MLYCNANIPPCCGLKHGMLVNNGDDETPIFIQYIDIRVLSACNYVYSRMIALKNSITNTTNVFHPSWIVDCCKCKFMQV